MITCPSCNLSSESDVNGKCPVCWSDIFRQPDKGIKNTENQIGHTKKPKLKQSKVKFLSLTFIIVAIISGYIINSVVKNHQPANVAESKSKQHGHGQWPSQHEYGWNPKEYYALPPTPYLPFLPDEVLNAKDKLPPGVHYSKGWFRSLDNAINSRGLRYGLTTDTVLSNVECRKLAWATVKKAVQVKHVDWVTINILLPYEDTMYYHFTWERPSSGDILAANPVPYNTYLFTEQEYEFAKTGLQLLPSVTDPQITLFSQEFFEKHGKDSGDTHGWQILAKNLSEKQQNIMVWFLLYDSEHKLVKYSWISKEVDPQQTGEFYAGLIISSDKLKRIKKYEFRARFL